MPINKDQLKIGDVVYYVTEKNNFHVKKKIKTVIDGVEWFRYDRDHWEYNISELIYVGRVQVIIEGEVENDPNIQNSLHFKYPCGNIYGEFEETIGDIPEWFHTREEAEAHIEKLKKAREE